MRDLSSPDLISLRESIRADLSLLRANIPSEVDQSIEASKQRCKSFAQFVREAWHVLEPETPYVHGWHIEAICRHLEAITHGQIQHFLANVPPGSMKSLLVSVMWPAWEWGPAERPHLSYIGTAYRIDLAERDNRRMRRLVVSHWYQARWPMKITGGDSRFENDRGGWREGIAFTSLTGGRANRLLIDDPHSVDTAESDQERANTIRTFRESAPDRLNNQKTDSIVIIMQRLHQGDVSGVVEELQLDYTRLVIPMEFESDSRCETKIGWRDPRTYDGELMCPERWDKKEIADLKKVKGSYAYNGQYQQRPAARQGGIFQRKWWKIIKSPPLGTRWVRAWDIAATEELVSGAGAYTVGVLMGRQPDGRFVIGDVVRKRVDGFGLRKLIKDTAKSDGKLVEIDLPQDPGATGKIVAKDLVLMLAGYVVHATTESRFTDGKLQRANKLQRAEPVAVQVEAGNVDVVEGPWNETFFAETDVFPSSKYKDQVDAMSRGFSKLIGGAVFATPEILFTEDLGHIPETFNRFAALAIDKAYVTGVWFAIDRANEVFHVYDTHVALRSSLAMLADAIWRRGKWIPILIDPTDEGRSEEDGLEIAERLASFQLQINQGSIDYDAGLEVMSQKLETGRLKVNAYQQHWLGEYRRMGRDDKGDPQFTGNNLMRATMLGLVHGAEISISEARANSDDRGYDRDEARAMYDGGSTGY